jgi:hypothetical protein
MNPKIRMDKALIVSRLLDTINSLFKPLWAPTMTKGHLL